MGCASCALPAASRWFALTQLVRSLSRHLGSGGLDELTVTTNGSQLAGVAQELADADLRAALRSSASDEALQAAITEAIDRKPKGHDFAIERRGAAPALKRHMSVTGG